MTETYIQIGQVIQPKRRWATQRSRYMTLETIGAVSDTPSVSLPAAAA